MAGMTKALVAAVLVSLSLGAKISGRSALTFDASAAAKNRPLTKASPTPSRTPASSPADCTGVRGVFDAGFGGCEVYTGNHNNHQFCHRDFDEGQGFYAAQVCSECLVCQALDSAGEKAAEESAVALELAEKSAEESAEKVRIDAEQERARAKENRALAKETAPTPPPTPAPTPAPGVSGVGDPHLTNMYGERFDLYRTGVNVLLRIPQKAAPERTLLLVEADTQLMGTACSDLYFQVVSISGSWTNQSDSLQVFAKSDGRPNSMKWTRFDAISLKVVHGQTREGTDYLNVFAKNVFRAGYPVGGLLGADDHTLAATPPPQCLRRVFLHGSNVVDGYTPEAPHVASEGSESSVAAAYS